MRPDDMACLLLNDVAMIVRYGGPGVAELVLEITPDVMVGKVRQLGEQL